MKNYHSDSRGVIALPANEYFDDECVSDTHSALGAFVQRRLGGDVEDFVRRIRAGLRGIPAQRAVRAEHRIEESYGIGTTIFLGDPDPGDRLILVSATTERAGIGLRAEPHFLYAALEGIIEKMNEHRLSSLTMPVLGSGHGGMPLTIAILFNLLALRSIVAEDLGRHLREACLVIFEGDAENLPGSTIEQIVSRLTS
ncbi:MAG TPA: macro domain-containing protein [Streptosporangiaceae bacterium]|nr:macro domain-containing protein [Streptosporangiaceae bacterium]